MAKPKQKQQVRTPSNKNITPTGSAADIEEEYDWVVVKKQKITILIPPLPVTKQSAMPNLVQNQPQAKPIKATNVQSPSPIETNIGRRSVSDGEKSVSTMREKTILDSKRPFASKPIPTLPGVSRPDIQHTRLRSEHPVVGNPRCNRTLGVCTTSKLNTNPRRFPDRKLLLHHSLRASILERKLRKAGGLNRWLTSLGLDQFVTFFQHRRVNKFQLVNLTMKKLKDMGAVAVGPRRKLMHSLACLCQPHCFETL